MGKKLPVEFRWVCTLYLSCRIAFLNSSGGANGKESSKAKCDAALGVEHTTNTAQSVTQDLDHFSIWGKAEGSQKMSQRAKHQ